MLEVTGLVRRLVRCKYHLPRLTSSAPDRKAWMPQPCCLRAC